MSKQKVYQLVESILLIVVGILIACSIIESNILDYLLGAGFLVLGVFLMVKSFTSSKALTFLLPTGIGGAILVGLGISVFAKYIAPVNFLLDLIIVAITAIGALFIIDSIIRFAKKSNTAGIAEIVIGCILLAFGLMFILWTDFRQYLWVIFGVLLAIFGVYTLVVTLVSLKK